jgi:hypothetical protein
VRASIADLHVIEPERQDTADPIALEAQIEVTKHIGKPQLRLEIYTEDGRGVFAPPLIPLRDENAGPLRAGESARLRLEIERALAAGSYTLNCALLNTTRNGRDRPVSPFSSVRFSVANGAERSASSSKLEHSARLERRQQRAGPT